jgi:hypothetical protein
MTRIVYATVVSVIFGCFTLLPRAQAVLPPPDGGYGPPDLGQEILRKEKTPFLT